MPLTRASFVRAVVLAAVSMALVPGAALADTTVNFDNLPSGTTLSNQYSAAGVTFDASPAGPADLNPTVLSDPSAAHSPPNVLDIEQNGSCGLEVNRDEMWGEFAAPRNHVNLFVGDVSSSAPEQVTLTGYDLGDNQVAQQTVTTSGDRHVDTGMSIVDPSNRISFIDVQGPTTAACLAIDDLSFDSLPSQIPPDFGISSLTSSTTVLAGHSSSVTLVLHRTSSSTGPVSLSAAGLPAGVTASFSPNPTSGGDASQITMTLSAASGAPPATTPVTITGTPGSASVGPAPRSTTIDVSVSGNFELRAQGIDVTQGVVNNGILLPSGDGSGANYQGLSWAPVDFLNDPLPSTSPNSSLVQGNRTVVRVYADARGAPAGGVPGVGAELHGFVNGVELPDSPLLPDYGPASLRDTGEADPAIVGPAERESDANAFTFTLPSSWTQGTISLKATLIPPYPTFNGPQYTPCSDPSCQARTSFVLNNIPFVALPWVVIAPLSEAAPGDPAPPASAVPVYQRALLTEPGANQFAVLPYVGTIDPTPEVQADNAANNQPFGTVTPSNPCPGAGFVCNRNANSDYGQAIRDWGTQNLTGDSLLSQPALPADILAGVNAAQRGVTSFSIYNEPLSNPAPGGSSAQTTTLVDVNRPLTSVGHETGHALGRNHADDSAAAGKQDGTGSTGCGGGGGPWPPDGNGDLQGIGLDTSVHPYKILADGLPGEPSQWYDLMSYCGGANENQHWISPFGWLHSISALWLFGQRTGRGSTLPSPFSGFQGIEGAATLAIRAKAAAAAGSSLAVSATILSGGSAQIDSVIPTSTSVRGPGTSPFELVSRGAGGEVVSSTPMAFTIAHDDPGQSYLILEGTIPAGGVDSIQIVSSGRVVAARTRAAERPRVRILAPAPGTVVGKRRTVTVRWRASGARGHILEVVLDYSADNGRHWRGIYLGPNRGHVRLPSAYFSSSRAARLRIVVNDGFNQVQTVSGKFRATGTAPAVFILDPSARETFGGEAMVYLHGQAFDDALVPLLGRRLRWLVNGAPLGTGATITATGLPPGADRITLRATDRQGRSGSASIVIHVRPVSLAFLRLRVPRIIGARAHRLTLHASSALTTILKIGGQRITLGRNSRAIVLHVPANRKPLLLHLVVTARGVNYPITVVVRR